MKNEDRTIEKLLNQFAKLRYQLGEGFIASWKEITEQKLAEKAIYFIHERYFKAFNASPCPTTISTLKEERFVDVNESFLKTFGFFREEVIGRTRVELNILTKEKHENLVYMLQEQKVIRNHEYNFRTKSGKLLTGLLSFEMIDIFGDQYVLGSFIDITERKQAEEELRLSEERFSKTFNASPNPMTITSKYGKFLDVNNSFERTYGYTREEVIGRTAIELNIWQDSANRDKMLQTLYKQGSVSNLEVEFFTKTGEMGVGLLSAEVIHLSGNECTLIVVHDITERKRSEEELRCSEERFYKAFHNNPTPMVIVRFRDDKHIDINKGFECTFGYSREETIGVTVTDLNLYIDIGDFKDFKQLLLEQGYVQNRSVLFKTKLGKIRNVLLSSVAIELNGEKCRLVAINDITEIKQLEKEMARLDRLNLIGEMAAGISHEIRNPLTTVRGFLQLLGEKEVYSQSKIYFDLMIEELDRASSIISEFLSLARNKAVNKNVQNLNKIVDTLLPLIQADAIKSDKNVLTELAEIPDLLLDDKEIRQLLLNLVRNGLDAMLPKGTLTVRTFANGEDVVLAVQDEGRGIEPDILEKIGTPFFTTKDNGTGLGLATCYSIAERHNARIDIDTGDTGTTFFVRFKI